MPRRWFPGWQMSVVRVVVLLAASLVLQACAVVTADGQRLTMTSTKFRAYVERVFREQNRLADQLAFALEDGADESPAVSTAEQSLLGACAPLNELATARRDERKLGTKRRLAAARSVPACEETTRRSAATLEAWRAQRR
jgi:MoxR-like ATPase